LRQEGYDGPVTLIGEETCAPYQRPPLSKKFLAGEVAADRLDLLPPSFFADHDVETLFARRAVMLDPKARRVTLEDGTAIAFGQAVIATGSRARQLPVPGGDLEGVYAVRTIADVERLRSRIMAARHAAIIGGGYIGLEVAAIVRGLGLEVTVIEAAPRVMSRTSPEAVSRAYAKLHRENGVVLQLGCAVEGIAALTGDRYVVNTSAGAVEADVVLAGIGGVANTELAAAAGLEIDNGIIVDKRTQTSAPAIFAIGDCAAFPSARYGARVRLESVQNAIDQAKAAAGALMGREIIYDPVPWFWSDQFGVKYQIAGLSQFGDNEIVRGDPDGSSFSVVHLAGDRLVALDALNRPRDYMLARRLIEADARVVDRHALADPAVPLDQACTFEKKS